MLCLVFIPVINIKLPSNKAITTHCYQNEIPTERNFRSHFVLTGFAISPEILIRRTSDLRTKYKQRKALRGWSAITPKQIQHKFWENQDVRYNWKADISFTGSRSNVELTID